MNKKNYDIDIELSVINYLIINLKWELDDLNYSIKNNESLKKIEENEKELILYYKRFKNKLKKYKDRLRP